jgi:hypothetical protein
MTVRVRSEQDGSRAVSDLGRGPGGARVLGKRQAAFLIRLAERIVPEVASASPDVRERLVILVDGELQPRPRSQQLQFKLLLLALRWLPVLFALRRFERLPPDRQDRLLLLLQEAPLTILRVGMWGLKTLVFIGYYSQAAVTQQIHYFPSKTEGNAMLHRLRDQAGS